MIISKTPCRLSFAGGGSDIESYYREHGGAVVSVTIDKYVYLTLQQKFDDHIRIGYSRTEEVEQVGPDPAPDRAPLPGDAGAAAGHRNHLTCRHSLAG